MKNLAVSLAVSIVLGSSLIRAQEPQPPVAQEQHQLLKGFTGKWISTVKPDPNAEPDPSVKPDDQQSSELGSGEMDSQMLGDFWVINRMSGDMGGTSFQAVQTIGYDSKKQKYVGTWVDTMMNHLWQYEGDFDAAGKKLSLRTEGPHIMEEGKLAKYRDSYEFKSPDQIITTSEMMGDDGNWSTLMTAVMTRSQ